jgi:hypothetical protein
MLSVTRNKNFLKLQNNTEGKSGEKRHLQAEIMKLESRGGAVG